ncbi:AAA family ATPase [Vibrio sp.]|uniref:AAA family ATPase n=1 Tax=Vibrio sp. TaxID=678 RepID=UPI003D0AE9B5
MKQLNPSSFGQLKNIHDNAEELPDFTLFGLLKGHVGMLIAAPDIGKSHLALSLAIEHASSMSILGLTARPYPAKTLIISSEDSQAILAQRISQKSLHLDATCLDELDEHLSFLTDIPALVIPPESPASEHQRHQAYIDELVELMSQFDLVIVDTVTEAIGSCDEVKHDRLIKNTFSKLAKDSGASMLLVHHVNKDEIRGTQKITMASGAGLTSVMRLAKFYASLQMTKNNLTLQWHKSNYMTEEERRTRTLVWRNEMLWSEDKVNGSVRVEASVAEHEMTQEPEVETAPQRRAKANQTNRNQAKANEKNSASNAGLKTRRRNFVPEEPPEIFLSGVDKNDDEDMRGTL